MKKIVVLCALCLLMVFCISAKAGDRIVSVGMGYGSISYEATAATLNNAIAPYWGGGFEISLGYEQEVFDHILLLGQVAFVTGTVTTSKVENYDGSTLLSVTTANGKAKEIHALVGVAYKYTFSNVVSVQAGLTLDNQNIAVTFMKTETTVIASDTTTSSLSAYAAANCSIGLTANVSYLINDNLSVGLDFNVGFLGGALVGAGLRYSL